VITHLLFSYTHRPDLGTISVRTACGINGTRATGTDPYAVPDGEPFLIGTATTCPNCCGRAEANRGER